MTTKVGTVEELLSVRQHLPPVVYKAIYHIVRMLDRQYGATRNVETSDGGYVIFADCASDLGELALLNSPPEEVSYIAPSREYINALFLLSNEYGINVIMPAGIAPVAILKELD